MLYKYVKRQPAIRLRHNVAPTLSLTKKNKVILTSSISMLVLGFLVMSYSLFPYIQDSLVKIRGRSDLSKSVLKPSFDNANPQVAGVSTSAQSFSSDYTANVNENISSINKSLQAEAKTHPELASVTGKMTLTISRLGLSSIPVEINVDSYDEKNYMPILENNLAHFKGTSLPGQNGNTFIYGHSTNELWAFANPKSAKTAFTYLDKLEIGDEIDINYQGKDYKYVLQKTSMVAPDDISPIFTVKSGQSLTLMTCWPPGIGTQRLILSADQI